MNDGLDDAAGTVTDHVAAAALGATARPSRPAALEPDTPPGVCANCTTGLHGPVCHICGQIDDTYHRSTGALASQMVEGLFNLDGRVARTVPMLLFRPGRLTYTYLKGARARFIPPFRLYIVASLIFFLLAGLMAGDIDLGLSEPGYDRDAIEQSIQEARGLGALERARSRGEISQDEFEQARQVLQAAGLASDEARGEPAAREGTPEEGDAPRAAAQPAPAIQLGENRRTLVPEDFGEPPPPGGVPLPVRRFLADKIERVNENPERWLDATTAWIPRIMFLLVPVYAGFLALTYLWRRRYFYYDHLIVSVHFHSALFLTMAGGLLAAPLIGTGWVLTALLIYSNLYLYKIHRVVYGRSRFTSVLRTLFLDVVYLLAMAVAFVLVIVLGVMSV